MRDVVAPISRDLAPGVTFGGYVVRELIGRGGMATVYRAEHRLLNKRVALKVMDHALLASTAARQRFVLEGRAASAIKHPNVVDITDVGVHDGVPYLVMELLTGEDLEIHLRQRSVLDEGSVIRLALPIISALHTAHSSGIVHRDIKPSNIFMSRGPDQQLVPKVLDFGISSLSFDSEHELMTTPHQQLIGTPHYLPPEALRDARALGPLADQYSLGVVLYQCVTGRTPFAGDTLVALLQALSRGSFESPRALQPSVSPGLDRVILRALSREPSERFPSIRELGRALLELAAERTQLVWGQSFRVLPTSHGDAAPPRSDPPFPAPSRPLPAVTERLSIDIPRARGRWQSVALGVGAMLVGALCTALWWLAPAEDVRAELQVATTAASAPAGGARVPPAAPSELLPEAQVALTPQVPTRAPADALAGHAEPAPEATRPRPPARRRLVPAASPPRRRAAERLAPSTTSAPTPSDPAASAVAPTLSPAASDNPLAVAPALSPGVPSPEVPSPGAPSPAAASSAPAPSAPAASGRAPNEPIVPAPSEPAPSEPAPRLGANASPLLD
jgi:eukaryotic-like serine/threonine-protein kinase